MEGTQFEKIRSERNAAEWGILISNERHPVQHLRDVGHFKAASVAQGLCKARLDERELGSCRPGAPGDF